MREKKFKYLIADTTAFINNVQLQEYAEIILTVPDVVNEVKNRRQIRRLVVLPFDLQVQEPDAECLKCVTEFAKKTGDFASLSAIDLKVIALTYELEKQHIGTEHLRKEPIVRQVVVSKYKPAEFGKDSEVAGFFVPKKIKEREDGEGDDAEEIEDEAEEETPCCNAITTDDADSKIIEKQLAESLDKNASLVDESDEEDGNENDVEDEVVAGEDSIKMDEILVPKIEESEESADGESSSNEDDEDDDSSWITPTNIETIKKQFKGEAEEEKPVTVACMSTDYAIQNVLKQINLNIAALNGRLIKQLRTYILRCYACFKTTSIMTKTFCPYCGNKTLKRVAVSLDENGRQIIHINLRRPLTCKYKNQSLPRPKGGKHSNNPILVEDQPIPKQMPTRVAKTKTNALEEDYIAGYSPFATRDVDSKSALLRTKGNVKQWARNNLYEENRRKKNSSRLVK